MADYVSRPDCRLRMRRPGCGAGWLARMAARIAALTWIEMCLIPRCCLGSRRATVGRVAAVGRVARLPGRAPQYPTASAPGADRAASGSHCAPLRQPPHRQAPP